MSELLFGLFFAHFFADFVCQTNRINELKKSPIKKELHKGLLIHVSHHLICYFVIYMIIFFFYKNPSYKIIFTILLIGIIHYFIDFGKVYFTRGKGPVFNAVSYIIDQLLHIIMIYVVLQLITHETHYNMENFILFFKSLMGTDFDHVLFSLKDKLFLLGSIVIITTHFYGYLLDIILKPFKPSGSFKDIKVESKVKFKIDGKGNIIEKERYMEETEITVNYSEPQNNTGKYIGMIERLVIVILMISKSISAVGFLIALKALSRFKQFDDKSFAEFYLIGTLLSIFCGFISSFFAIRILHL